MIVVIHVFSRFKNLIIKKCERNSEACVARTKLKYLTTNRSRIVSAICTEDIASLSEWSLYLQMSQGMVNHFPPL